MKRKTGDGKNKLLYHDGLRNKIECMRRGHGMRVWVGAGARMGCGVLYFLFTSIHLNAENHHIYCHQEKNQKKE